MGQKFISLKDVAMLMEINRHKWLESEKAGRDIGFTAAAKDWLDKYSDNWQRHYCQNSARGNVFIERREFRRFALQAHVKIVTGGALTIARVANLSFVGVLCQTANKLKEGSRARIHLSFAGEKSLNCVVTVERSSRHADKKLYELFLRFDENIWQSLFKLDFLK